MQGAGFASSKSVSLHQTSSSHKAVTLHRTSCHHRAVALLQTSSPHRAIALHQASSQLLYTKPPPLGPQATLEHEGRLTIELFSHLVPKSAENFRSFCTGQVYLFLLCLSIHTCDYLFLLCLSIHFCVYPFLDLSHTRSIYSWTCLTPCPEIRRKLPLVLHRPGLQGHLVHKRKPPPLGRP